MNRLIIENHMPPLHSYFTPQDKEMFFSHCDDSEEASAFCSLGHFPFVPCTLSQAGSILQAYYIIDTEAALEDFSSQLLNEK
jgi:hypothetical protein